MYSWEDDACRPTLWLGIPSMHFLPSLGVTAFVEKEQITVLSKN